ncbi:Rv1355c family protein [Rhodococcoides corynebacterioides]|uniref:Rv1355c family protein n=1 Tax=Rhodococcoides corynebacterioides TaxID=53972 RepID=A0ABS7P4H1_9NOCA|nr:Rv1355c family protein [Rhodococcus corynebacterioides]MBY6367283.1 Rv1355c family protein [Rhodococcus corynebacterioides]MBY6408989.1 Rv1355c family protein [Rhodococcus corynebacterioides]
MSTPPTPDDGAATVLDPRDPLDLRALHRLSRTPGIRVLDTLARQRSALAEVVPTPDPEILAEAPRWVHYPWRHSLVHLLGPRGFRLLRLDRNRNKITTAEQERLRSVRIGVVGLSVGHAVAHTLALEGLCGELHLADFDTLDLSNLNRIPAGVLDLGVPKTDVAARRIAELDPYLDVRCRPEGIAPESVDDFVAGVDLVIEECDSLDVKVLVREAARRQRVPVIMETSDRGLLDVERFDLEPDRPLFHGSAGVVTSDRVAGLSTHDKVPYVMAILGADQVSARFAASMVEVDRTVSTWPQLGGDVALGGATVAAAVRRWARGDALPSGRVRIDVDAVLDRLGDSVIRTAEPAAPVPARRAPDDAGTTLADRLAYYTRRAPSGGNVQPWIVETTDRSVTVTLDPRRTSGLDVRRRGSAVAVGAAVLNARITAAAEGFSTTETVTDLGDDVVRAEVTVGSGAMCRADAELFPAMTTRATNRHHGTPHPVDAATAGALADAAAAEGCRFVLTGDRVALTEIGEILAESDRVRYLTPHLHAEMMSELRWPGDADPDTGIDVDTLAMDRTDLVKLDVARRPEVMAHLANWDTGSALGDDARDRLAATSAVGVVVVDGDGPTDFVRGGRAVQRVWITAERWGLAVHPVSPVFLYARTDSEFRELAPRHADVLAALRSRLLGLFGVDPTASIGLVMRLSHGAAPAPPSRRRRG